MSDFTPDTWLASALGMAGLKQGEREGAFKILTLDFSGPKQTNTVRVLHKESGAVWRFECSVERGPA